MTTNYSQTNNGLLAPNTHNTENLVSVNSVIPKAIYQTYKKSNLTIDLLLLTRTWKTETTNKYKYFFMDDKQAREFITNYEPAALTFFDKAPVGAMKADIWRYIIIEKYGGIYTDIDTRKLKPIDEWKIEPLANDHMMVISLEHNQLFFCQWAFMATPKHPLMKFIISSILERYETEGFDIDNTDEFAVHKICGPGIFSDCIKSFLGVFRFLC